MSDNVIKRPWTPGPWEFKTDLAGIYVYSPSTNLIACNMIKGYSNREANARLMAAAPGMYEALEKVKHAFDISNSDAEFGGFCDSVIIDINRILEAANPTEASALPSLGQMSVADINAEIALYGEQTSALPVVVAMPKAVCDVCTQPLERYQDTEFGHGEVARCVNEHCGWYHLYADLADHYDWTP